MSRRTSARRIDDREAAGALNFDVALETYLEDMPIPIVPAQS
jgi:hypothetical protein